MEGYANGKGSGNRYRFPEINVSYTCNTSIYYKIKPLSTAVVAEERDINLFIYKIIYHMPSLGTNVWKMLWKMKMLKFPSGNILNVKIMG